MDRSRYNFTEHRHAISAQGVQGLSLFSLRIESSGGDGIDLSANLVDIEIRNVIATDNYRQGMSVISAVNMLVQDCVFARTRGTAPESGVDFEPDFAGDRLTNISFINVSTVANHGAGFSIWTGNLRENGLPIDLTFINCTNSADEGSGINIGAAKNPGAVEFMGHVVQGCHGPGIYLNGKNHEEFRVALHNSILRNVSVPDVRDGVYIDANGGPVAEGPIFFGCMSNASRCGGVLLANVTVDDSYWNVSRNFLSVGWRGHPKSWSEHHIPIWNGHNWTDDIEGVGVIDLHGRVRVFSKPACCPSGRPLLVSDGEGGRVCHSNSASQTHGEKVCCLTAGDHGCPVLTHSRPMPLCRHLPGDDHHGHCDTAKHVCTAGYGPRALNVTLEVECIPAKN
eukprot:COSAG02_NODE_9800_length_2108_cov_1.418616_1_plen_396_part_00